MWRETCFESFSQATKTSRLRSGPCGFKLSFLFRFGPRFLENLRPAWGDDQEGDDQVNFPESASHDIRKGEDETALLEMQERIGQNQVLKNHFTQLAEPKGLHRNARTRHGFLNGLFFPAAGDLLKEISNAVVHPQVDDFPLGA
jgi:hypothetical protein